MDPREHWVGVYGQRAPSETSWYQAVPALSLSWILAVLPDRRGRIIDVGAGASTLVDGLLAEGYSDLTMLDIAPSVLDASRQRLGERGANVQWVAGDLLAYESSQPFDLWHDRAALHFLRASDEQERYAKVLNASLRPGGHAIIATFAIGGPTRCSGLEIVQYDEDRIAELVGSEFQMSRREQEIHRTPSGAEQLFSYFLLQRIGGRS